LAVFERFMVGEDGVDEAELSGPFQILLAPDLLARTHRPADAEPASQDERRRHRNRDWRDGRPA
jgi:hypothetical protein